MIIIDEEGEITWWGVAQVWGDKTTKGAGDQGPDKENDYHDDDDVHDDDDDTDYDEDDYWLWRW